MDVGLSFLKLSCSSHDLAPVRPLVGNVVDSSGRSPSKQARPQNKSVQIQRETAAASISLGGESSQATPKLHADPSALGEQAG